MSVFSEGFDLLATAGDAERSAALLRASVDLFVAIETHSDDEIRLFGELCINLQAECSPVCRRYVAEKLAGRSDAPSELIRALALAPAEISEPVILQSPVLEEVDLLRIVSRGGAAMRLVTRRPTISETVKRAIRLTGDADAIAALPATAEVSDAPFAARAALGRSDQKRIAVASKPEPSSVSEIDALAERLFEMKTIERMAAMNEIHHAFLAEQIRRRKPPVSTPKRHNVTEIGKKLFSAATAGRVGALAHQLAELLDIDIDLAQRIVADPGGEPFTISLRAVGIPEKQAISLFIHVNDEVGRSVERIEVLSTLYPSLPSALADRIVGGWRFLANGGRQRSTAEPKPQRRRQPQRIVVKTRPKTADRQTGASSRNAPLFTIHRLPQ